MGRLLLFMVAIWQVFVALFLFLISYGLSNWTGNQDVTLIPAFLGAIVLLGVVGLLMKRKWGYWLGTLTNIGAISVSIWMAVISIEAGQIETSVRWAIVGSLAQVFLLLPRTRAMFWTTGEIVHTPPP